MSEYISLTVLFVIITKWSVYAGVVRHTTVVCRYKTVDFLQNNHNKHNITWSWRGDMGCLENYNTKYELQLCYCYMVLYWLCIYMYIYIYIFVLAFIVIIFYWHDFRASSWATPREWEPLGLRQNIIHISEVTLQLLVVILTGTHNKTIAKHRVEMHYITATSQLIYTAQTTTQSSYPVQTLYTNGTLGKLLAFLVSNNQWQFRALLRFCINICGLWVGFLSTAKGQTKHFWYSAVYNWLVNGLWNTVYSICKCTCK